MPDAGRTHGPPATKNAGGSYHRFSRNNRHSPRGGGTVYTCSPRCAGLSSHRRLAIRPARLDPSVGGSGPHDFAVRFRTARQATRSRPPHPAPTLVTMRSAPLVARDAERET